MNLPLIPQDKANHAVYGALVFAAAFLVLRHVHQVPSARNVAMAAVLLVALAKELADWWANRVAAAAGLPLQHSVDPLDVLATCAGGALCWTLVAAVQAQP